MFVRILSAISLVALFIPAPCRALDTAPVAAIQEPSPDPNVTMAANGKQIIKNNPDFLKKESPVVIAPHRAIYTMTLASAKNGSNITGVSGKMAFEWADDCGGWAVQQHLQLHFSYAEGDEADVNSTVLSWESKDGKRYNFNVRRTTNGKETERYRGRAGTEDDENKAVYTIPDDKPAIPLQEDTLFPSAHTKLILEKALEGEKFFTRRVFDGSDEEGEADVSAFIGEPAGKDNLAQLPESLRDNPLVRAKAWPVRLAFFKPDSETGESDYEMDLLLQENGVTRSMLIDYGDFSVAGTLASLEPLPPSGCEE